MTDRPFAVLTAVVAASATLVSEAPLALDSISQGERETIR